MDGKTGPVQYNTPSIFIDVDIINKNNENKE